MESNPLPNNNTNNTNTNNEQIINVQTIASGTHPITATWAPIKQKKQTEITEEELNAIKSKLSFN